MTRLIEPSCGACGYSTVGLMTMTCPECGGDLRQVGIVGRTSRTRRARSAGVLFSFTLAMVVIGAAFVAIIIALAPDFREYSSSLQTASAIVRGKAFSWGDAPVRPNVQIEVISHAGRPTSPPKQFDPQQEDVTDIWQRLVASGDNPQDFSVSEEAALIFNTARRMSRTRTIMTDVSRNSIWIGNSAVAGITNSQETNSSYTPRGLKPGLWAVWGIIWAGGINYLWRLRRPYAANSNGSPK